MSTLLEQASLVMIPSGYKEDVVYSQIPTNGNGDLSFTRASNGTRINSSGLVEVVPWNLLQQSNAFTTSPWFFVGTPTLTANYDTNPLTGANDAWRFQSASSGERVVNSVTGAFNTFSVYAKGTGTLRLQDSSGTYNVNVALNSSWQRISLYIPATSTNVQITSNGGCDATIWGAQLNIGSTANPYFPTTDRLNVPRLTYQNGGGGCPSLLLEPQRTNVMLQNTSIDNSAWTKFNTTATADNIVSPDGTQNADKVTCTASTARHGVFNSSGLNVSGSINDLWTYSVFVKKGNLDWVFIDHYQGVNNFTWFNISNGTIGTVGSGATAKIENYGNGWYRLSVTKGITNTVGNYLGIYLTNANGVDSFTATGSEYVYIWGSQMEYGSYQSTLIYTTSASVTRVADACYKTGISSLIGQSEGVLFAEVQGFSNDTARFAISDGTNNNNIYIELSASNISAVGRVGAVNQFSIISSQTLTNVNKIAIKYKTNDFALYVNGVQVGTDTSGSTYSPNTLNTFRFDRGDGGIPFYGNVKQIILFPNALTNAELASLTTI